MRFTRSAASKSLNVSKIIKTTLVLCGSCTLYNMYVGFEVISKNENVVITSTLAEKDSKSIENDDDGTPVRELLKETTPVPDDPAETSPTKENFASIINETWYPSDEWVQSCTKDMVIQSEAEGEWDSPYDIALADCIKFCSCYNTAPGRSLWFNNFYKTRACPLSGSGQFNFSLIDEIHKIQSHYANFTSPAPDALVVHLRLGDVVELSEASVEKMLISGADPGHRPKNYRMGIKSVREILDNIRSSETKTVHIVGGSHKKNFWRKSRVYAGCLQRAVQFAGYNVTMRLEGIHPDVDFFFVSHAKQLVVSVGGYSNLMGKLVEHRGGRLVGRSFGVNWMGPPDYKDDVISKKELTNSTTS